MQYAIYEDFYPDVKKKLDRIAKKCCHYGNDFVYEVKGEEIREVKNSNGKSEHYKFVLIEVEGTARINDWECVAVSEIHDTGNIIRKINTDIEIPNRFRHTENVCEHCNSKRYRNKLYIIHNINTGEWKQVGGSCLSSYTHGLNLEYVVAYLDGITSLSENDGIVGIRGKSYYNVKRIIGYAVEVIDKTGYFNAQSRFPTKSFVARLVYDDPTKEAIKWINDSLKSFRCDISFDMKDFCKEETEELVKKIIEYYQSLDDNTDFIHNVQVMLTEGYVLPENIGYLCYLPQGYAKHIKKEQEKAKRKEVEYKSEFFGEIGKRYKDLKIDSVSMVTSYCTQFGIMYVYQFVLSDGNILIWKTSSMIEDGEIHSITFTVKNHSEYKGIKQTEVTRCKIA